MKSTAWQRAEMPTGTSVVLDERSLEASNANLLTVLKEGQQVMDMGCGSGAITQGIAKMVGKKGSVLGIDRSQELIDQAKTKFASIGNLSFDCADILDYPEETKFDIITTARTLQWIADPAPVIQKMIRLLRPDGILCVLDYNHTRIEWDKQPPQSMLFFYDQFLRWRSDAGMDNDIGDHIGSILETQDMKIILSRDQSEYSEYGTPGFQTQIAIWTKVAQTRGRQLVSDGYLTEKQRLTAIDEYTEWCATSARWMKLNLMVVHATRI